MTDRVVVVRAAQRVTVRDTEIVLRVARVPQRVVVCSPAQDRLTVVKQPQRVVVRGIGLQGPAGADGAPGGGGSGGSGGSAEKNFPTPTAEWVFDHDLGFTPAVSTYSPLGVAQRGLVTENGPSRTVVTFYIPVAGRMTLS
jgi:hypothetical protein